MAIPLAPGERAHMYALGGVMRGGVGRAGCVDGRVYMTLDGQHVGWGRDDPAVGTLLGTLQITDSLDETPNRCTFRVNGAIPASGCEVIATLGSKNRLERLFAGYGLTVQRTYAGIPANVQADVTAVDYTWLLGFAHVTAKYVTAQAGSIIWDLIQRYAAVNGFTTKGVALDLPVIDEITFTNEDLPNAITRICRRVGAYWYCDYRKDIHAFITEVGNGTPPPLVPTHRSLTNFVAQTDRTQVLSRVYVEGRGSRLLASVNAGDDRIPLDAVDMFAVSADVFLKASFQGSDGGAQHLQFAGVVDGTGGTLVGPGATPGGGPTLDTASGGAVDPGAHGYAYTWVTAGGETKPSALASITVPGTVATGTLQLNFAQQNDPIDPNESGAWRPGDYVEWSYSYSTRPTNGAPDAGTSTPLAPVKGVVVGTSPYHWYGTAPGSNANSFEITVPFSTNPAVKWIDIYHRINGGGWRRWMSGDAIFANDPTDRGYQSWAPSIRIYHTYNSQAWTPATTGPTVKTVNISGIAVGPTGTTARKLYRTKANATTLLLLGSLLDNTTTGGWADTAADSTLGATAPASDTSGLPQPQGQIQPGATSVIVASSAPFRSDGGWAILGNGDQVVRYTGISGGAISGVPASGRGSLTAVVVYNTTITAAPMLTGIPNSGGWAIQRPLTDGDEIYLVVQVDNPSFQGVLANALHVASGVRDEWIADRRLSIPEARARGQATLGLRAGDAIAVSYACRDLLTQAGKTIHVELPAPTNVLGDFKIQQVVIAKFRPVVGRDLPNVGQYPTYTVQASNSRFSFEDFLNRMRTKE